MFEESIRIPLSPLCVAGNPGIWAGKRFEDDRLSLILGDWLVVGFIISILINALTLFILSKIPLIGIEINKPIAAFLGGAIIGIFSSIWNFFPQVLRAGTFIISLGLIPLIGSIIVFGLAAWLVEGFRLRNGFWSLIMGAIAFTIINAIMFWLFSLIGLVPTAA
ncbi:MAG: phage holin family protein [Synechococcales bacterium]|nr:phage holin family protein [Synechococcales bacterium]